MSEVNQNNAKSDNEVINNTPTSAFDFEHEDIKNSNHLHTPSWSDSEDEIEKLKSYILGEGIHATKFQLDTMFNNKDVMREAVKNCVMDNTKNVFVKNMMCHSFEKLCTWFAKIKLK